VANARADRADDNFNTSVQSMENNVKLMMTQMQTSYRLAAEEASTDRAEAARQAAEHGTLPAWPRSRPPPTESRRPDRQPTPQVKTGRSSRRPFSPTVSRTY